MHRTVFRSLIIGLLALFLAGSWFVYYIVSTSMEAERNLHATLFTISLVEQFVNDCGRWPKNWEELDSVKLEGDRRYRVQQLSGSLFEWPASSTEIRQRVYVDFQADPQAITIQSPMAFYAIRPFGKHYPYQDYGFIESLQKTIRYAIGTDQKNKS